MEITKDSLLAKPAVFLDNWDDASDVFSSFCVSDEDQENIVILYAEYGYRDYSGSATVFGYNTSKDTFFEVRGSRCSCYGLAGQWEPMEVSIEEIAEFYRRNVKVYKQWVDV